LIPIHKFHIHLFVSRTYITQEAESNVDKARTKDEAFKSAITAAELYMEAVKNASNDQERARLRGRFERLLSRAEEIKKSSQWPLPKAQPSVLKAPASERSLTRSEEIILLEASKLHGFIFPPWKSDPEDSVFDQGQDLYT
jgi:calpain-7